MNDIWAAWKIHLLSTFCRQDIDTDYIISVKIYLSNSAVCMYIIRTFLDVRFFKAMASVNLSLYYVKVGTIFKKLRDYFNLAKLSVSVAYVLTILMY